MAFSNFNSVFSKMKHHKITKHSIYWIEINENTLLFVVPFIGRNLRSNNDIQEIGSFISMISCKNLGNNWFNKYPLIK